MVYRLEDLLGHLAGGDCYGLGDDQLAKALELPVEYLRTVRGATGM
jgi:hypothetical protein